MIETCDVAIIGAGPAGANAGIMAASQGCHTIIIDEQAMPGGQIWRAKSEAIKSAPMTPEIIDGDKLRVSIAESNLTHIANARVWQIERELDEWVLHFTINGRSEKIGAKVLILATGAREYVQPTPGWTLPGVIGLAGATALMKRDLLTPGKRTVVSGTGPLVFFVASEIRRLGGEVAAIVTPNSRADWLRALPSMSYRIDLLRRGFVWVADLLLAGIPIFWRHAIKQIDGETKVQSVKVTKLGNDWSPKGPAHLLEADSVCLGHGLQAASEASQLLGIDVKYQLELGGWVPEVQEDGITKINGLFICGDGAGIRGAAAAEIQGKLAGLSAAKSIRPEVNSSNLALLNSYRRASRFGMAMTGLSIPRKGFQKLITQETIVCRCESLLRCDIENEIETGAATTNAVKSGSRAGMGPCGGKYCQSTIAKIIADRENQSEEKIAPPTPRPPLRPVSASALSGEFEYTDLQIPKPAPL